MDYTRFKKDYKLAIKRHRDIGLLDDVIQALSRGDKLPEKNKDHELSGDRTGTHSTKKGVHYDHQRKP